jgi:hypothetical protein
MTRFLIIATFSLLAAFASCEQITSNGNAIFYNVDFNYMEGCETGKGDCKPVEMKRHYLHDIVKVIFPNGGTQSSVYLYRDTAFTKWMKGKPLDQPKPLRHDQKVAGQGNPVLDLTGLPDGKYTSQMLSCGVGGTFELTIKTEKPQN